jgi:hypothetical protein
VLRIALTILLLGMVSASARPPPGSDPESVVGKWFARQTNMRNGSCCGEGDGHRLADNQWRIVGTGTAMHYDVQIDNRWYPIEDWQARKQLVEDPNPTGVAIVWYSYNRFEGGDGGVQIYCFAPGSSF